MGIVLESRDSSQAPCSFAIYRSLLQGTKHRQGKLHRAAGQASLRGSAESLSVKRCVEVPVRTRKDHWRAKRSSPGASSEKQTLHSSSVATLSMTYSRSFIIETPPTTDFV